MIPFIDFGPWHIGPFTVALFGMFVATGVMVGSSLTMRFVRDAGYDELTFANFIPWMLVGAFFISHIVSVVFYFPEQIFDPWYSLLAVWQSLSSFGGVIGAVIIFFVFCRIKRVPFFYIADPLAYGFVAGLLFGRIGCYTAHDHPGKFTEFLLAVRYPEGTRHDLGFYEVLLLVGIFIVLHFVGRRKVRFPGYYVGVFFLMYAPVRFCFDYLRVVDIRYLGLTPGQYFALAMGVSGIAIIVKNWGLKPLTETFQITLRRHAESGRHAPKKEKRPKRNRS